MTVPSSILSALKKAISVRQETYDQHVTRPDADQYQSGNEGHLYFINVLKDTLPAIQDCFQTSRSDESSRTSTSFQPAEESTITLGNYNLPTVVDDNDSDQESDGEIISRTPTPVPTLSTAQVEAQPLAEAKPDTEVEAETMTDAVETFLAIKCLLADVEELRQKVQATWTSYVNSEIDLITAAVSVNTAIAIVQKLEDNFNYEFPNKDMRSLLWSVLAHDSSASGKDIDQRSQPNHPFNHDCYEIAKRTAIIPYDRIRNFASLDKVDNATFIIQNPGLSRLDDDWSAKDGRQKYMDDSLLLRQMCSYYCLLSSNPHTPIAEDHLMRGIKLLQKDGKMSLWLAFAGQCYLEAHYVMHDKVDRPLQELRQLAMATRQTAIETLKYHADLRWYKDPFARECQMYQKMVGEIDFFITNDYCRLWCQQFLPVGFKDAVAPMFILGNHPLLSGLWAFEICQSACEGGLSHCIDWGSFLYGAHLFNAITQEAACHQPWPEMQHFMSCFSDKELYFGSRPQNVREYQLRAMQRLGFASTNAARNRRDANQRSTGEDHLTQQIPLSYLLKDWYNDTNPVDELDTHLGRVDSYLNQQHTLNSSCPWALSRLQPVELLDTLILEMESEIPRLKFDLLSLHRQVWSCLRRLKSVLHNTLVTVIGSNYLPEGETQLPVIVCHIFDIAVGRSSNIGPTTLLRRPSPFLQGKVLSICGGVVDQFLEDQRQKGSGHPLAGRYDDPSMQLPYIEFENIPELADLNARLQAACGEALAARVQGLNIDRA